MMFDYALALLRNAQLFELSPLVSNKRFRSSEADARLFLLYSMICPWIAILLSDKGTTHDCATSLASFLVKLPCSFPNGLDSHQEGRTHRAEMSASTSGCRALPCPIEVTETWPGTTLGQTHQHARQG
jgi:hypothetical protein